MTVETAGLGHDPNEEGSKQWETLKDEDGSTTGWEDLGNSTPAPTPTTEIAPTPTPTPEATPDSTPEAGDETPGEELLSETELPAVEGFKEWYLKSKQEHPEIPEEEHLAQLKKGVAYQFDLTPEDSAKFKEIIVMITGTPEAVTESSDELTENELHAVEGFKEWYLKSKQEHPEIPEEEHLAQLKKGVAYQFDLTPEDSAKFKRIIKIITE